MSKQKNPEKLMKKAINHIDSFELKKAARIGKKLLEMRYTGGFEVLGLVYLKEGKIKKAINVLEKGVKKGPGVWLLWQLLGNSYSDNGQYKKALKSYSKAMKCPHRDKSSIYYNTALVYMRQGRYEDALNKCNDIKRKRMYAKTISLTLEIFNELKQFDECIALGEKSIKESEFKQKDVVDWSSVHAEVARAYWEKSNDRDNALKYTMAAIDMDKANSNAMWLLREIENRRAKKSKYYRIIIEGKAEGLEIEDEDTLCFYANYDVVAENRNEALDYIKRFEPEAVRDSLKIEDCEVLKKKVKDPKGVYCSDIVYWLFPLEE